MEQKNKTKAMAKETGLERTTLSPFAWVEDLDRWFDNFRRSFEERLWSGPLARWSDSALQVHETLVDVIDKGSEFVVRAELPGVSKEDVDLTVTSDGIPSGGAALPRGEGGRLLLPGADLPSPPPGARLPRGGQGRPRVCDFEGRLARGPGPEEGADSRIEARQSARRVGEAPLIFPFPPQVTA